MSRRWICEVTCDGCGAVTQEESQSVSMPEGWTHLDVYRGGRPEALELCQLCSRDFNRLLAPRVESHGERRTGGAS
jgi:hypothetical protein